MIVTSGQKIKSLQKYFRRGSLDRSEEQIAFWCPVCQPHDKEKKKLVVRISDGWYHCWVCGLSGKSYHSLLKKTFPDALHDSDFSFVEKNEKFGKTLPPEQNQEEAVSLPEGSVLVGLKGNTDPDILSVVEYLKSRGLNRTDMLRWRICAVKEGPMRRKAIFPSFDQEGNLNYFVSRSIDNTNIKYFNSKRNRTEIIFNEIDVDWSKPVTLVEGVFDAVKCPENTVPVLGSSLPKDSVLFRKLWQNQCNVTVAFDPDLKEKSHRACELLSKAGLEVRQVWAPEGSDFGSMSKKEVLKVLSRSEVWRKESKIFFKIKNISSGSIL